MSTILINLDDQQWTMEAMHRACMLARQKNTTITLLHLMPVQHLAWLGTDFGIPSMSNKDRVTVKECAQTAEDYGVMVVLQPMRYATFVDAIADAADCLDADYVFVKPHSGFGLFKTLQQRRLKHELTARGHLWMTTDDRATFEKTATPIQQAVHTTNTAK